MIKQNVEKKSNYFCECFKEKKMQKVKREIVE